MDVSIGSKHNGPPEESTAHTYCCLCIGIKETNRGFRAGSVDLMTSMLDIISRATRRDKCVDAIIAVAIIELPVLPVQSPRPLHMYR